MSKIKLFLLLILTAFLVGGGYVIMTTPGLKPEVISPYEGPLLKPSEESHDLGTVPTDDKIPHTFYLYNVGGKPLVIRDVQTSCGCTVVEVEPKTIEPGNFAKLHVMLDTSIKIGEIRKSIEVYSNDSKEPVKSLYLTGNVIFKRMGHEKIEVKDPLVLFKGECATCHVDQGKGKTGKALFQADCGMCHGMEAQGAFAKSLTTGDFDNKAHVDWMRKIIQEGSPNVPTMPPFAQAHGGPLTDSEVESLVNYLKYQSTVPPSDTPASDE